MEDWISCWRGCKTDLPPDAQGAAKTKKAAASCRTPKYLAVLPRVYFTMNGMAVKGNLP
jgi:hypothetical protein